MTKRAFFTALLISLFGFCYGQNITELSGDIIYYNRSNDSNHPVTNAFDGNTNTYFMASNHSGNWIGYDLGEKHVITKIEFAPRMDSDYRHRLQLGIFEGANNPDFGDAIALHIIPGLTERMINEQEIISSRGFRYVRFVFPTPQEKGKSNYMSYLKFYGYQSEGDNSRLPQLTNLPTVNIHTVNNQDITSKDYYIRGIISIIYNDGTSIQADSLDIRGRGNASWGFEKKPYRIKLDHSTRVMNLPATGKNWTLINNWGDKTLMRNMLAFDFSRRLEMAYTSPAEAVDVVLNGDYKGTYQLCDHIDVRKGRVEVEEMTENDLTGGYMLEIDAYAYPDEPKKFTSKLIKMPVTIKYPKKDEITAQQEKYIENHFNSWINGVYYKNKTNMDRYMDPPSFLRHFLVGEYSGNTDTYWSVRVTKRRDDDRLFFGPVWDFDLAFENDERTYPINSNKEWVALSTGSSAGSAKDMVRNILSAKDVNDFEYYNDQLSKIYAHYRDNGAIDKESLLDVVDSIAEKLDQSQQLNFKRWQIMQKFVHQNPRVHGSYEAEVENVKNYISGRIDWMDRKLSYGYYTDNEDIEANEMNRLSYNTGSNLLTINEHHFPQDITIYDASGRLINQLSQQQDEVNLTLHQGIYLIRVESAVLKPYTVKCIIP